MIAYLSYVYTRRRVIAYVTSMFQIKISRLLVWPHFRFILIQI